LKYIERQIGRDTIKMEEFGSIGEFLSTIHSRSLNSVFDDGNELASQRKGRADWSGTDDYPEALDLLEKGWSIEAQTLAKAVPIAQKTQMGASQRHKPVYSVVGGQASVPRYLQGIPTNMIDRKAIPMKHKILVLNKSMTYAAKTNVERIRQEGIKTLRIIQTLEARGYRTKLFIVFSTTEGYETNAVRICIKRPEERLSLQKIAFPMVHPAMLRRIGFRWLETAPNLKDSKYRWGYGTPDFASLMDVLDRKEIMLPGFLPDHLEKFIEEQIIGKVDKR